MEVEQAAQIPKACKTEVEQAAKVPKACKVEVEQTAKVPKACKKSGVEQCRTGERETGSRSQQGAVSRMRVQTPLESIAEPEREKRAQEANKAAVSRMRVANTSRVGLASMQKTSATDVI